MGKHPGGRRRQLLGASAVLLLAAATGLGLRPGELRAASRSDRALAVTASRQARQIDLATRGGDKEPLHRGGWGRLKRWVADRWGRLHALIEQADAQLAAAEARDEYIRSCRFRQEEIGTRLRVLQEKSPRWPNEPKAEPYLKELARIEELIRQRRAELLKEDQMRSRAFSEERRRLEGLAKEIKAETVKLHLKAKHLAAGGLDPEDFRREVEAIEELVEQVSRKVKSLQTELDQVPPRARKVKDPTSDSDR